MSNTAQDRLGTITVELGDAEGSLLASALVGTMQRAALTPEQTELAVGISEKMLAAIGEKRAELVAEYGAEGAEQLARESEREVGAVGEIAWFDVYGRPQQEAAEARDDGRCEGCGAKLWTTDEARAAHAPYCTAAS